MTCINSEDLTRWQADLAATEAQIAAIDIAILSGPLNSNGVKEYTFDSGTGRQTEKFNSPQELFTLRKTLMNTRDLLVRKIRGTNLMTTSIRRSSGSF